VIDHSKRVTVTGHTLLICRDLIRVNDEEFAAVWVGVVFPYLSEEVLGRGQPSAWNCCASVRPRITPPHSIPNTPGRGEHRPPSRPYLSVSQTAGTVPLHATKSAHSVL
jgi:hypothetical protein